MYVVAPIPDIAISTLLESIDSHKPLIIDRYLPMPREYSYISQEFDETTYMKLVELLPEIRKYKKFVLFFSDDSDYPEEPLEIAALQIINVLFGVPQLSIILRDAPKPYKDMIAFYTRYWNDNSDVFTTGDFKPSNPLANYRTQRVSKKWEYYNWCLQSQRNRTGK